MKSNLLFHLIVLSIFATSCFVFERPGFAQTEKNEPVKNSNTKTELDSTVEKDQAKRIANLENKVKQLERILFSTSQLSVYDAERRLSDAKQRLAENRRLRTKGFVSIHQVELDQFLVRRAEKELQLAQALKGHHEIAAEIDVLQADFDLQVAQKQLEFSRGILSKGYVTQKQVDQELEQVDRSQEALATAKEKLEAVRKLAEASEDQ